MGTAVSDVEAEWRWGKGQWDCAVGVCGLGWIWR